MLIPPAMQGELDMLCAGRASTDLVSTAPRGGPVLEGTFWSYIWLRDAQLPATAAADQAFGALPPGA